MLNVDNISDADTDAVIRVLAEDYADGEFDGQGSDGAVTGLANVGTTELLAELAPSNPDDLTIPGTNMPLSSLADVLEDELESLGSDAQVDQEAIESSPEIVSPTPGVDSDGDLVIDALDACPDDANETVDTDGDGVCDNSDAFPEDDTEVADSDGDQVGDNAATFPFNAAETVDSDGDCLTLVNPEYDFNAPDAGNDCGDGSDLFVLDPTEYADGYLDGVGDNADQCDETSVTIVDGEVAPLAVLLLSVNRVRPT